MWASLAGRPDPETGEMQEYRLPTAALPHSILADAQGNIWYTGNSNGMIGKLNPASERFQSWAIPSGVGIVRHVWVTRNGELLIHQSSSNRVGRVRIEPQD
jgi:virginiamycin B lyase